MLLFGCCSPLAHGQPKQVDPPVIVYHADVDEEHIDKLLEDMRAAVDSKAKSIMVVIDSPGGSYDDALRFVRAVQMSPIPVSCVADGMAASAAFVMLQGCTERAATPQSLLLFHQGHYSSIAGPVGERKLNEYLDMLRALDKAMIRFCAQRMGMPVEQAEKKLAEADWWMGTEEGLKVHAIDLEVPNLKAAIESLKSSGTLLPPKK